ncbi:MAG: type II toxin-antitoxin system RelE/ParE family toxin [Chloroflexi bacterium]|nr:type II toxin-antitoxin system RelE/ParE family toxin [Chloroflexota bacterium]
MARPVRRTLDRLPRRDSEAIMDRLDDLAKNPKPRGVEKIRSRSDLWRIRQGDYRIVYSIDDEQKVINVWSIGHRRDVYRSL